MSTWRRLPAPVPPAQHETVASWLHRLAAVHGLHASDLRAHLGIGRPAPDGGMPGLAARLAAVTGYPPGNLARALPELRVPEPDWPSLRHLAQRACPRCTARHQGGPVRRLFAHHEYLCTRHGYWIGPPDPSRDDPPRPLAAQVPELTAAQRTLGRTRRLHGWEATFDATAVATSICIELRIRTVHQPLWTRWERRLGLLMPGTHRRSLFMAAIFPEVAALAAVVAAPPGEAGLLSAVRRALGYTEPPHRHDVGDALSIWATGREAGPFLRPASAYSHAGHMTTARRASPKDGSQPSGRPLPVSAGTGARPSFPARACRCPTLPASTWRSRPGYIRITSPTLLLAQPAWPVGFVNAKIQFSGVADSSNRAMDLNEPATEHLPVAATFRFGTDEQADSVVQPRSPLAKRYSAGSPARGCHSRRASGRQPVITATRRRRRQRDPRSPSRAIGPVALRPRWASQGSAWPGMRSAPVSAGVPVTAAPGTALGRPVC